MEDTQDQARKDSLPLFDDAPEKTPGTAAGAVLQTVGNVAVPASIPLPGIRGDAAAVSGEKATAADSAAVPPPAPERVPVPVLKPAPRFQSGENGGQAGFGRYLRELRMQRRLSVSEVGEATKIRSIYIEAIEEEDYASLPPVVYVLAYVKTLCAFYGLDEALTESLTVDIRQRLEYEAPGDPSKSVVDMELSEENPILLKRILLVAGAGVFLVTVALTLLVLALTSDSNSGTVTPTGGAPTPLDEKRLLEMQPQPALEVVALPPDPVR